MPTPPMSDDLCAQTLALWQKHGRSYKAAAEEADVPLGTFSARLQTAKKRFKEQFESGGIGAGPARDGFDEYLIKGVSTYYNADGEQRGQWVKTKVDDERRLMALKAVIEERAGRIEPLPFVPAPDIHLADFKLCNLLTLTDCHIGALAWHREGGEDWDLTIARETLTRCYKGLLASMPAAGLCVINQMGDFLHTDGLTPTTPEHGNILDADSRFQKLASVAADVLEDVVIAALERHDRVHLIPAEGNHDESSSAWLRIMFRRLFRDNPRMSVEDSPLPFYAYEHGATMLAIHHGHKVKPDQLPMLFASEPRFAPMWGRTTKRYGHSGHQHHLYVREHAGMIWTQHPTLAARDAYAARGGWIAERAATGYTYSSDFGQVGSITVTPEMYR